MVLRTLGWLLLIFTIGLATCQTLLKAEQRQSASVSMEFAETSFRGS